MENYVAQINGSWYQQMVPPSNGIPWWIKLCETLNQRYYHPKLRYHIDKLKCKDCQKDKLAGRGYGLLPIQKVRIASLKEVAISLIGPWKVKDNGHQIKFDALTCIDTALNLVKLIRVE
jgi:hypothetical protein